MGKPVQIKFYSDAGHGWGAVKVAVLKDLNLLHKITPFSYVKGQTVYLEEDLDLPRLVNALEEQGKTVEFIEKSHGDRSPIRSYPPYSAPRIMMNNLLKTV